MTKNRASTHPNDGHSAIPKKQWGSYRDSLIWFDSDFALLMGGGILFTGVRVHTDVDQNGNPSDSKKTSLRKMGGRHILELKGK